MLTCDLCRHEVCDTLGGTDILTDGLSDQSESESESGQRRLTVNNVDI